MFKKTLSWAAMLLGGVCQAQPFDVAGRVEVLPAVPQSDWLFIGTGLVDVVDDRFLGVVGVVGRGPVDPPLVISPDNRFIFTVESFYTRGNRGERTDTVTILDATTLGVADEVVIPPKIALMLARDGAIALSDDNRFLAVFNLTPATSLSIVDVESRTFVEEIQTPGAVSPSVPAIGAT